MLPTNRFAAGDNVPGRRFWRDLIATVKQLALRVGGPFRLSKSAGQSMLSIDLPKKVDARCFLESSSTTTYRCYPQRFEPTTGGFWFDVNSSALLGSSLYPCYEYNLAGDQSGSVVELIYTSVGDWRFLAPPASGGTNPGTTGLCDGCCPGRTLPDHLYITTKYGTFTLDFNPFYPDAEGLVGIPPCIGQNRTFWWVGSFLVYEPTAISESSCGINSLPARVAGGGWVHVSYGVQCIPSSIWYHGTDSYLEPGMFIVRKGCRAQVLRGCNPINHDPPEIHMCPIEITTTGGSTYFEVVPGDPCAISLSATLRRLYRGPLPDNFYECVAMAETVTVTE